ncbi:MAG: LysM peptidoglycan-binding domain-containing protein [Acidobacteria bacterium]|nr:LysM peptidoglycan-binding domain-containing protein [Acidobacteriota bacterium]
MAREAGQLPPPVAQLPSPETLTVELSPVPVVEPEDPIDLLIGRARGLLERGERLFGEGAVEAGRLLFQQALDTLKNSGFEFFLNPHLESTYYDLLGEIQELELQALVDPAEIQLLSLVSTPSDEITDLNFFTIQVDPHLKELVSRDLLETRFDIPVVLNDDVVRLLNFYQNRGRDIMEEGLKRAGKYVPLFREIFQKEGVPLDLVYMAHVESHFKPNAYSRAKARGSWQFMLGTAKLYGLRQDWWIDERSDLIKSTEAAARHLTDLYERFGDWNLAMAAYNVGPNRIDRIKRRYGNIDYWAMIRRRMLPRETRLFVPSILATIIIFRNPERYGFWIEPDSPLQFETVSLEEQVAVQTVAEELGIPVATLFELNPELRRGITPFAYKEYQLKVPLGTGDLLKERLAALPEERKLQFRHHRVLRGETLGLISQAYSSSIQAIAQVNQIRNIHRLREGQDLLIPLPSSASAGRRIVPGALLPDTYTVRRGDSLSRISLRYRVTVADLLLWNNLRPNELIYPGQRIRLLASPESVAQGSSQETTGDR